MAVPKARQERLTRGHPPNLVQRIIFDNPREFFAQSGKFRVSLS